MWKWVSRKKGEGVSQKSLFDHRVKGVWLTKALIYHAIHRQSFIKDRRLEYNPFRLCKVFCCKLCKLYSALCLEGIYYFKFQLICCGRVQQTQKYFKVLERFRQIINCFNLKGEVGRKSYQEGRSYITSN